MVYKDDFVYITCGDLYYMDLIEKLVISLLNVSDRKIIVYGINCKVPFDYPNLIKREFVSSVKSVHDKWFWKQQTCIDVINVLQMCYKNYVWLDGDIIANYNIDSISQHFSEIENYPIGEVHIHDEQITVKNGVPELMGEKICEHFGINRKVLTKDLHACCFVFNNNCKWFFEEIIQLYNSIYDQGLYDKLLTWNDESLHNFMYSKYSFTKTLPLSNLSLLCEHTKYVSNPRVLRLFYGYWYEDSPNNFGDVWGWNYVPENKDQVLYFHENKNLNDADEMIEFVKMKKNNGFNSSRWFFTNKYKITNFEKDRSDSHKYDECKSFEYSTVLNILPGDTVLDIGSDIGFFERYAYLKKASKIICFEPDKEKFELLSFNAHKETILFNADVSNFVDKYIVEKENKEEIINTYSIDYLFNAGLVNKIDFIKIDNKDKEETILNGINEYNLSKIRCISIKWYNFDNLEQSHKDKIVNNFLTKGFNCWVNVEPNFTRLYFYKFVNNKIEEKTESIQKMFITEDAEILLNENAEKFFNEVNDKDYLVNINDGIIKVDYDRWKKAQIYEDKTWNRLHMVSDDRNYIHQESFDDYRVLNNNINKGELSIIELGCGPFTNLRLILEKIQNVKNIDLLDPLIHNYINLPNCSYKNNLLNNYPVNLIQSSIEEYDFINKKYDVVVMINVLEHCMDIDLIFTKIKNILKPNGIFIFSDCCIKNNMITDVVNKLYDVGHPLRISESKLNYYIDQYDKLYYKELFDQYEQPWRIDKYCILQKKKKEKVISFSIYGSDTKYTVGLLKNLELVESVYPEWLVYIYYNNTVPIEMIEKYKSFNFVRLFDMSNENMPGMFWRFLPYENVERFISRDADSRISIREKNAVDEWIKSGKSLHIMRDHPVWHNVKMFGGMFGLVVNENLKDKIEQWLENKDRSLFNRGCDCDFLFDKIYDKYVNDNDVIAHDSYHIKNFPYSVPFPSMLEDYRFIGEIFDENDNRQDHYKDWIDKIEIFNIFDKPLYIYHHLGLGDHIVCNAIVRNYAKKYKTVYLFVKPNYLENVKYMYRDLTNLNYIVVGDDNDVEKYLMDKKNVLKIRVTDDELTCNFDEYFYKKIGMNFEKRWTDFYIERDHLKERKLFDELQLTENNYIFIHDDVSRNCIIDRSLIRTELKIVTPDMKYSFFDYQYILENAREIHVMESSFKCLIENLDIKGDLFYHKYVRYYPKYVESSSKKKWVIYE